MKQLSRKLAAFFLTLAILLSFATVAYAHDGLDECEDEVVTDIEAEPLGETSEGTVSPQATCTHSWGPVQYNTLYSSGGTYVNNIHCMLKREKYYVCTKCGQKKVIAYDNVQVNHNIQLKSASCTGTVQTWHRSCAYCGGNPTTETRTCPGGPHIGSKCLWLPI